jgi:5-formaminoimidazole-4-carboxamide-1-beta-D-ribofuranosyl 5'-monophosphate synthetase
MIRRSEIQDLVSNYDCDEIRIGIFGSQSALEQGLAAKYAGFRTVIIVEKGRDATYVVHNPHLFDEIISVTLGRPLGKKSDR